MGQAGSGMHHVCSHFPPVGLGHQQTTLQGRLGTCSSWVPTRNRKCVLPHLTGVCAASSWISLELIYGSVTLDNCQDQSCWPGTIFVKLWLLRESSPQPWLIQEFLSEILVQTFSRFWNVRGGWVERVKFHYSTEWAFPTDSCPHYPQVWDVGELNVYPFDEWKAADSYAYHLLSSVSAVTLSAAPPSYFRGFTLIALKENREGDKEEDHAGTFQVRPLLGFSRDPCRSSWCQVKGGPDRGGWG